MRLKRRLPGPIFYLAFRRGSIKQLLHGVKYQIFNPSSRQQIKTDQYIPNSKTGLQIPLCEMFVYFSRISPFLILLLVCKP